MRLSLIVTTHERPAALQRVLQSIHQQVQRPDELIIADDGSGPQTTAVVAVFASHCDLDLQHVRQPHEGFRLARLRNLAIIHATGDYLVFIDGDMVLHPEFTADHRRAAIRGFYCQGVRIPLTLQKSLAVLDGADPPGALQRGIVGRRRLHAIHLPACQPVLRPLGRWLLAVKGCNQGFWREDLWNVDGYDESFVGWGHEDKDLCWRLERSGIRRNGLLAGGLAYHLDHPPADRSRAPINRELLRDTHRARRLRAVQGLHSHGETP